MFCTYPTNICLLDTASGIAWSGGGMPFTDDGVERWSVLDCITRSDTAACQEFISVMYHLETRPIDQYRTCHLISVAECSTSHVQI